MDRTVNYRNYLLLRNGIAFSWQFFIWHAGRRTPRAGEIYTQEGGTGSDFLCHATKIIIPYAICRHIFKSYEYHDHMLCAYEHGKGTCQVSEWVMKFKVFKTEKSIFLCGVIAGRQWRSARSQID